MNIRQPLAGIGTGGDDRELELRVPPNDVSRKRASKSGGA
jgi:hypothetical protein